MVDGPKINPRPKQYVVTRDFQADDQRKEWKRGQLIRIQPDEYRHYIAGGFLVPLDVALRQEIYPPKDNSLVGKLKQATTEHKGDDKDDKKSSDDDQNESDKKLLGNKLRDAVQAKKNEAETKSTSSTSKTDDSSDKEEDKPKIDKDKLEAIKKGGK